MPQIKDKRRTLLGWTGGAAVVVLGALAVAAPVTRVDNGNRAVVVSAHGDFTAPRETLDAVKWLSDRGRTNGFRFNADREITHLRLMLEPAEGTVLPVGGFHAQAVRFDEAGRVCLIASADSEADGLGTDWTQDSSDPRYWFAAIGDDCPLGIDSATLEVSRACHR